MDSQPRRSARSVLGNRGDLAERVVRRGRIWFWTCVVGTAASQIWRGVSENPTRVTRAALLGAFLDVVAGYGFAALNGLVVFSVGMLAGTEALDSLPMKVWYHGQMQIVVFFLGRLVASRLPGREIAGSLIYILLAAVLSHITDPPRGIASFAQVWMLVEEVAFRTPAALGGAVWKRLGTLGTA